MQVAALFSMDMYYLEFMEKVQREARSERPLGLSRLLEGYTLLALNIRAVDCAMQENIPFIPAYELLGSAAMRANREQAVKGAQRLAACGGYAEGWTENWPERDFYSLRYFLESARNAATLVAGLAQLNVSKLAYCQGSPLRFTTHFASSDVLSLVLEKAFPENGNKLIQPKKALALPPIASYEALENTVCFFIHHSEFYRMSGLVKHTAQREETTVVALCASSDDVPGRDCAAQHVLLPGPMPPVPLSPSGAERYLGKFGDLLPPGLEPYAEWYVRERWARLEGAYRHWLDVFQQWRPKICLASTPCMAEFDPPVMAARRLGIPVSTLTHGMAYFRPFTGPGAPAKADMILCAAPLVEEVLSANADGIPAYSLRQFSLELEHRTVRKDTTPRKERHVLFAYTMVECPYTFAHRMLPQDFITTAACFQESYEQREGLSLSYKGHPGMPGHSLLKLAGIPAEQIVPAMASMRVALAGASVFVSYNYTGAPILIALKMGIPTVLLTVASEINADVLEDVELELPADLAEVTLSAGSVEEAWAHIDRLMRDKAWRDALLEKQRRFVAAKLGLGRHNWFSILQDIEAFRKKA